MTLAEIGWAKLPRRGIFVSDDGFVDCDRQKKTKKAEVVPFRTASASCYLKSLKMSSNAKSRAVFMLFYMKDRISASSTDFFFFFFFFFHARSFALHLTCKVEGEVIAVCILAGVEVTQHFMLRIFQTPCGEGGCGWIGNTSPQILSVLHHHVHDV